MPTISSCPFCQAQVAVPQEAAVEDEVRCPLCQAQFSLDEAIDIALPELILVRGVAGRCAQPELVGAGVGLNGDAWGAEPALGSGHFHSPMSAEHAFDNGALGLDLANGPDTDLGYGPSNDLQPLDSWDSPQALATAEGLEPSAGVGFDTGVETVDPNETGIVAKPRKKRKEPNMAIEMLKVMLGGGLGLFITYICLMWAMKNFDPLQLGHKLPAWMVPERHEGPRS